MKQEDRRHVPGMLSMWAVDELIRGMHDRLLREVLYFQMHVPSDYGRGWVDCLRYLIGMGVETRDCDRGLMRYLKDCREGEDVSWIKRLS